MAIALNGIMSCFQCEWSSPSTLDTGLRVSRCLNEDVLPAILARFDEAFLPLKCGHFAYRDKVCHICKRPVSTPLYISSNRGVEGWLPVCGSHECSSAVEEQEQICPDNLAAGESGGICMLCGYPGREIAGNFCSARCEEEFRTAWADSDLLRPDAPDLQMRTGCGRHKNRTAVCGGRP